MEKRTGRMVVNEINTIPGFTSISMFPKLWEATGLGYSDLLARLVELGIARHRERAALKTDYRGA
jgi:D-alanine-D-alanine ligase